MPARVHALRSGTVCGALADGAADRTLRHGVAGADLRGVGQGVGTELDAAGGDQRHRVGGQRRPDEGPQRGVARGVADEHATEQRPRVVAHHELRVRAGDRVVDDHLERTRGDRLRVTEARDVDAEHLELRGHVQLGGRHRRGPAEQPIRHHLGHGVAGGDQTVGAPFQRGDLADRPDRRIGGAAAVVDEDTAPLPDRQPGGPGQRVGRPDAGGEHDDVGVELDTVGERRDQPVAVGRDPGDRDAAAHGQLRGFDEPPQQRATALVDLHGHQPRRDLDDLRRESQRAQRPRGLEPEQPAPDDDRRAPPGRRTGDRGGRGGGDRVEVVERAVDEAAGQVPTGDGRHERHRSRGQHERVVVQCAAARRPDDLRGAVERDRGVAEVVDHRRVLDVRQRQLLRAHAVDVGGERNPVVGRPALLAENRDAPAPGVVAVTQRLDEPVRDHAVADHEQLHAADGRQPGLHARGRS